MASIARSLRAVAPLSRALAPRAAPLARVAFRPFSTTNFNLARRYTKEHEWIDLSADKKSGYIGISEYAAEQLGDVVYVELPESRDWVEKGDAVGAVESVKSASDINAPIRLRVTHVNESLEEKPSTINKVPEDDSAGGGWIAKVEIDEAGAKEFEQLMDSEAYKAFSGSSE
ncbi:glycine cleavage H-protein-domain-containing protein [Thelonectria olida]|uniref:Glycine cleavage system H protein n=1 Tax=Thelonectria olida TaxID=1576542 RepID=A0A9P8W8Z8_9HYPO|nr:glycine cleavage H-protein-domain-containing protein [Thelonectria olida]